MRILTWNIGGLGKKNKRISVKRVVRTHKLDLLHLQETKLEAVDYRCIRVLWGSNDNSWGHIGSTDSTRGLILICNTSFFTFE
ncbi:hypothetical protein REPUB_Repub15cG0055700 [Reevesia pubescens]